MRQDGCAECISASLSLPRYHGERSTSANHTSLSLVFLGRFPIRPVTQSASSCGLASWTGQQGGPRSGGRGTKKGLLHEVANFVQQPLCICPYGAIGASRTRDPLLRRQMLYPSELQPQELLEFTKNTRKVQAVPCLGSLPKSHISCSRRPHHRFAVPLPRTGRGRLVTTAIMTTRQTGGLHAPIRG